MMQLYSTRKIKKIPCLARFTILCAGLKLKTQNLLFVTFWSDWLVEFQLFNVTWLPLSPSTPLPCSPIPLGKVPSKNLLGHQNLIGPTSRPASHWLLHLSTLFRGSILLRLQHLRARRSCDICLGNYIWNYICLGNYSTLVLLSKLGSSTTNSRPAAPQIQSASSIKYIFCSLKKYLPGFLPFSVRFIRRTIEDWTRALAHKWKIHGPRFFRNKFCICREQLFKFDANLGEMCKANSWNPPLNGLGSSVGSFVGKNKSKKRIDRNLSGGWWIESVKRGKKRREGGGGGRQNWILQKHFCSSLKTQRCYRGGRRKCLRPCTAFARALGWNAVQAGSSCRVQNCAAVRGRPCLPGLADTGQTLRCTQVYSPLCCRSLSAHCVHFALCTARNIERAARNVQRAMCSSVQFAVSSQETWVVPAQTSRQPRLPQVQSAIINICTHYRWWVWGLTRCTWIQIIQKPSIHRRCSGVVGLLSTIFCSRPQLTVQPEQSHSKASI